MTRGPLALALGALGLVACAPASLRLGPVGDASADLSPLGAPPLASLAIDAPVDARPPIERKGGAAPPAGGGRGGAGAGEGPELWAEGPSVDAAHELALALRTTLRRARVARDPRTNEGPDYTLVVRLEHLYVARHPRLDVPREAPPGAGPGRGASPVEGGAEGGLVYGNAGLRVTLVEGRSPAGRAVRSEGGSPAGRALESKGRSPAGRALWSEYVAGATALRDGGRPAAERARREALRQALARLAWRLGGALDRLGRGPSVYRGPARSSPPPVFLVERVSRTRALLETLYVDAAEASVVRHEVSALPDPAYGRPGEWLLSRRTIEGLWLPDGPYEALARALGPAYDLRALDDAERYHFFGPREAPAGAPNGRPAAGAR